MHSKIFTKTMLTTVLTAALIIPAAYAQDDMSDPVLDIQGELDLPDDSAIQPLLPETEMPKADMIEAEPLETAPITDPVIQEVEAAPAQPETEELAAPKDETISVPDIPDAASEEKFDEDIFFDAEALVPTSELAKKGAPSKVNPALNPGSRLVVTRTNANPGSKEARLVAAERAVKLGRYESALQIYEGLYASNKRDPNILIGRATALQRVGRNDEAIEAYEELLAIRPRNVDARVNMQGLLGKRYPAVALRNLIEIHEDNPGNTAVVAQLAVVEAQMGRYPEAIRYLGMAASMEPQNANHIYNMAVIADRAGDKKMAVRYYEEALEVDTLYGAGRTIPRDSVFERLAQLR